MERFVPGILDAAVTAMESRIKNRKKVISSTKKLVEAVSTANIPGAASPGTKPATKAKA